MESTYDVFLTCLPRDINENVIRNLLKTVGNVLKVKIIEDKKNENNRLGFVGFASMDEATEAVRLADRSTAFGDPIKACISKKSLDGYDSRQKTLQANNDYTKINFNDDNKMPSFQNGYTNGTKSSFQNGHANDTDIPFQNENGSSKLICNVGRGRGNQIKRDNISAPSSTHNTVKLKDITLNQGELIAIEIVDLSNLECIHARPILQTEKTKAEITESLLKINATNSRLFSVNSPKIGECYLGKWDDGLYYRAELLESLDNGSFKVEFVDEGTSGDIVSEIRHMPEGLLRDYPKQFSKVTLGCKHKDELTNFIMNESNDKKVSLFWLGHLHDGIPLVNLFLNEDEIIDKYISLNKINIKECYGTKFKSLPTYNEETDCSHITSFSYPSKSLQHEVMIQIKTSDIIKCNNVKLFLLPTPGDVCIYKRIGDATYFRCVVRRRHLLSFDILLIDSGEDLNNISIDCLFAAEDIHKIAPPCSIICESSGDALQSTMPGQNVRISILSYKGNNRYVVNVDIVEDKIKTYLENVSSKYLGQSHKVLVTHLVSPLNFFVQIDKVDTTESLTIIQEKLNAKYDGGRFTNLDSLIIGQAVVAPFAIDDGVCENFRATIIDKRQQSPQIHVLYVDYGNDSWVDYNELVDVTEDIMTWPPLALHCTLNVNIRKEAWSHAIEIFSNLVGFSDTDSGDLIMDVVGNFEQKFLVDIRSLSKGPVSLLLEKSGTCFVKDDDKINSSTSLCNGDLKKNITKESSPQKEKDYKNINNATDADYASLLMKFNDLEARVAILESKV